MKFRWWADLVKVCLTFEPDFFRVSAECDIAKRLGWLFGWRDGEIIVCADDSAEKLTILVELH